jgi:hypothetical protein
MQEDEGDCDKRYLAVKVIDDVFTPWLSDVSEARRQAELQTHHRQARVTSRDGELPPEIAGRRRESPYQEREQGRENEEQVNEEPKGAAQGVAKLHGLIQAAPTRRHEDRDLPSEGRQTLPGAEVISLCVGMLRVQLASQLTRTGRGFNFGCWSRLRLNRIVIARSEATKQSRNRQAPRVPLDRFARDDGDGDGRHLNAPCARTPPHQTPARPSGPKAPRSAQSNAAPARDRSRRSPRGAEGGWSRPRLSR